MTIKFRYVPAADPSVDPEWDLLDGEGKETGISIQDCRAYGGGYAVNRHGEDAEGFFMQDIANHVRTLSAAQEIARKAFLN